MCNRENRYEHQFTRLCPNNGELIDYSLVIETAGDVIMVEEIVAACGGDASPVFHEALAEDLIGKFPGVHRLTAEHGGVRIETRRERLAVLRFG